MGIPGVTEEVNLPNMSQPELDISNPVFDKGCFYQLSRKYLISSYSV